MEKFVSWVEAHPGESVVFGGLGVLVLLWLLGYFSSDTSNAGASNLASAYYAAEANQAVVGGQIQMANINATASTAQAGIQANAATAIATTEAGAATTINGQNVNGALGFSNNELSATYSNNQTAQNVIASNNATALTLDAQNNQASEINGAINNVIPAEIAATGSIGGFALPNFGTFGTYTGLSPNAFPGGQSNPEYLALAGYLPQSTLGPLLGTGDHA